MQTLHLHDNAARAASHLVENSALKWKAETTELVLDVKSPKYVTVATEHRHWSDGEKALVSVLQSMANGHPALLLQRLWWLDDDNREAVHTALGIFLGVIVAVPLIGRAQ